MSGLPHNRITEAELAAMPPKARKYPKVAKIYFENDFLKAYAMHTDLRVAENPEGAIGNHLDWDEHGRWQFEFLKQRGLKPEHRLLEIGCGTGRLARKVVPYLDGGIDSPHNYWGVDISKAAISYAEDLGWREGWSSKLPMFSLVYPNTPIDFAWAFSVLIHLPEWEIQNIMRRVAKLMHKDSQFLFSFVPEKVEARTGLKQYRHQLRCYEESAAQAGLSFSEVSWPHQQKIALAMLL